MKVAYKEAGDLAVDTRHLLIGLLESAPNPAAQLLASLGVSAERLRAQVARRGELLGSEPIQPPGENAWVPAIRQDGQEREGAGVCELVDLDLEG